MSRILIIEDEGVIRSALRRLLERNRYDVVEAENVEEARQALAKDSMDLVIADLRLPDGTGTDVIAHSAGAPVLVMTSYASVRSAVESMKSGAADYIAKPFDHDEMLITIDRILGERRLRRRAEALKSDVERAYPVSGMVGSSQVMRDVFSRIEKVAPTDTTVLILGESGTGKELVARALHERSRRRDAPMITVNCAAIPGGLIESELFGHEKGSFTGAIGAHQGLVESADGGTLFLDEIGELPLDAQGRLLRVLHEGEIRRVGSTRSRRVDVRLMAATHRDLPRLVREGGFREDLYFRLRVMEVELPPLREREADIPALAGMFLKRSSERLGRSGLTFDAAALDAIVRHGWPGNVRELENAVERAAILVDDDVIGPDLLYLAPVPDRAPGSASPAAQDLSLEDYFRHFVETHQGQLTETELARRLGISRKALWERRQRLGMPRRKD